MQKAYMQTVLSSLGLVLDTLYLGKVQCIHGIDTNHSLRAGL